MQIFHFDPVSGAFLGRGVADADPLQAGQWLLPAFSTLAKPPACDAGKLAVFDRQLDVWALVDAPAPPPTPEPAVDVPDLPTVVDWHTATLARIRGVRDELLVVVTGLQVDLLVADDLAGAIGATEVKQALRDLPSASAIVSAESSEEMLAAAVTTLLAIAVQTPAPIQREFTRRMPRLQPES